MSLGVIALFLSFAVFTFPEGDGDHGDPMANLLPEGAWLAYPSEQAFENVPFLERNLVVTETNLVERWPTQGQIDQFGEDLAWQNFGAPPDLRDRDLRYADFTGSIFVHGDFRDANLEGADLSTANLQRADLRGANLQGANLKDANLEGAER